MAKGDEGPKDHQLEVEPQRAPKLVFNEIICHGDHMDALHYGGQPIEEEAVLVQKSLNELRQLSGQPVKGWISPAKNESHNTPQLLAANGIEYFCDWVNDDMPYEFYTDEGVLTAMPLSTELEDKFILMNNLHSESSYKDQIIDACDFLLEEASTKGGRILALNLHPWLLGQPHRIHILEQVFEYLSSKKDICQSGKGWLHCMTSSTNICRLKGSTIPEPFIKK